MTERLTLGLIITITGMGLVFAALALLWGVMAAMQRLFPPDERPLARLWRRAATTDAPATPGAEAEAGPTAEELAAIMAALALWREEEVAEKAIGWRLPPRPARWLAVGRSRQLQSWSPRR
ncbi:MAG: OadG family protein [Anaerolineae bacterium]|nr:OadG family protein [Anaerolineae bacterium]